MAAVASSPVSVPHQPVTVPACYRHPNNPAGVVCQRCDRQICPQCMHQASVGFHCPECTKQGKQKVYTRANLQVLNRPVLTQIIIGINAAVYLAGLASESSDALAGRGLRDRFVEVWIERVAGRIETSQAEAVEHRVQVGVNQAHAFGEGVAIVATARGFDGAIEVVDNRQQFADDTGDGHAARFGHALVGALAVVLEVGLGAKRQVLELVALGQRRRELVELFFNGVARVDRPTTGLRRTR